MADNPLKTAVEWLCFQPGWNRHVDGETPVDRKLVYATDAGMDKAGVGRDVSTLAQALVRQSERDR
jgi:hypothetical protein